MVGEGCDTRGVGEGNKVCLSHLAHVVLSLGIPKLVMDLVVMHWQHSKECRGKTLLKLRCLTPWNVVTSKLNWQRWNSAWTLSTVWCAWMRQGPRLNNSNIGLLIGKILSQLREGSPAFGANTECCVSGWTWNTVVVGEEQRTCGKASEYTKVEAEANVKIRIFGTWLPWFQFCSFQQRYS